MERMSQEEGQKWDAELMRPFPGQIDDDDDAQLELEQLNEFL